MQSDYYRSQITDVITAGVADDDHFRVKVFGKRDSKFLAVNPDQLRCLADVLDETNPPTLLPLQNGHRVIRADTWFRPDGVGEGYVIADVSSESAHQFVTWHVYLHEGECRWLAEHGDYCSTIEKALVSFNERRGDAVAQVDARSGTAIETEEGATFTPWSNGRAIGYKVTAVGKPDRYIVLNPSGSTEGGIDNTDAFLYLVDPIKYSMTPIEVGPVFDEGALGGMLDSPVCFVTIWGGADD